VTLRVFLRSFLSFVALALAGCGSANVPSGSASGPGAVTPASGTPIRHVIIVVQENRSFDNLFNGYPGADTVASGTRYDGSSVALQPVPLEDGRDVGHFHYSFDLAYDAGRLDGFEFEQSYGIVHGAYQVVPEPPTLPFAYVPSAETKPYWALANGFTLADRMFQSNSGPSYTAHQYLIAGQSADADEVPTSAVWGCDAAPGSTVPVLVNGVDTGGIFPCFGYATIADELDAAHVDWRFYQPPASDPSARQFSAFDAVRQIRFGPDWKTKIVSPETTIFSDLTSGNLPAVSYLIPQFANSDHALAHSNTGPSWITAVVNAVGASPYWNSTAILITWDDWGGWYDHVNPPQLDGMGLGFRVPLLVVSPYAKHGYVSHVRHEFGSILRFTEETFGLPSLGTADSRADDLSDCFDFTQPPAPFHAFQAPVPASVLLRMPETGEAPDPI